MPITPAIDVGGFGRLAEMKIRRRAEEREERRLGMQERSEAQRYRLGQMQIQQMESNLQKTQRQAQLRQGLGQALSNIPEGENQFTTAYNYFMQQGDPDSAVKYMDAQSDRIDQIYKMDPEAGINVYNQTIGKATGNTLEYKEKDKTYGDVFKAKEEKTDKRVFLQKTSTGFEPIVGYVPIDEREDKKEYAPTTLAKLITERQSLIDEGRTPDDPIIQAYDDKITGQDIDLETMTPDEIDTWGKYVNLTGKLPSVGRGKQATKIRVSILKSAARQALGADEANIPDIPDKTPAEAALNMVGEQADTKAIQGSLNFLEKQIGSMGSFVTNLNSQIDRVGELSKDIKTFDTRLLNVPLRGLRGKILGSPLQSKYDMFLAEIESEIGKLSTGSTASIAELSTSAQEKWSKIHDKNLSVNDMLDLLQETRQAANLRLDSIDNQLIKTRNKMVKRDFEKPGKEIASKKEWELLKPGERYIYEGKTYRKK